MINMNIFFNFIRTFNKKYIFKIGLNIFIQIQAKFTDYFITLN